jgi:hypothetical protein
MKDNHMKKFLLLIAVLLSISLVAVQAQDVADKGDNDPTTNQHANACLAEGVMAGICESETDWVCGWFVIRYQFEILTEDEIPEACSGYLVFAAAPVAGDGENPAGFIADMRHDPLNNRCAKITGSKYIKVPDGMINSLFTLGGSLTHYTDLNCRYEKSGPGIVLFGSFVVSPRHEHARKVCGSNNIRGIGPIIGSTEFVLYQCQ